MSIKLGSLHGEVKSYMKVAQDRIEEYFFIHPESRKPKSAAAIELIISRIDETCYPFSADATNGAKEVWRQALDQKRDEMIAAAFLAVKQPEPIKKTVYIKKGIEVKVPGSELPAVTDQGIPGRGVDLELPAAHPPAEEWTKARIEHLKINVKAQRCGSWIAREFKVSPSLIGQILNGTDDLNSKTRSVWLDRINAAFKKHNVLSNGVEAYKDLKKTISAGALPEGFPEKAMVETMQSVMDASQGKGKIVADASIVIREGKFFVEFSLDITLMARMYIAQHGKVVPAIDSQDCLKITFL